MRTALKNMANVRIGYQPRERLEREARGSYRIVQMRDINAAGAILESNLSSFTPTQNPDRYLVSAGDVLFLARGNRNRAYTAENLGENVVASSHFLIVTPDPTVLRPVFLAWYLNSRPIQSFLRSYAQGTTMMLVPRTVFESIEIEVLPLEVQERVMKLVALRDKQITLVKRLEEKRDALVEAACLVAIENVTMKESRNV